MLQEIAGRYPFLNLTRVSFMLTCRKDHDKDNIMQQKIATAGRMADRKAIERQIRVDNPIMWRSWGMLWVHEREEVFNLFQVSGF